jgi:CDP-diacylglycerol---serine O-phosphatidyltransferase
MTVISGSANKMKKPTKHAGLREKGIYLLPNLFTLSAMFFGFYAMMASIQGQFTEAAVAIFIGMVMDGLDGRVARLTHTQTAFGAELDSLSDMVTFGVAPALVMLLWQLQDYGRLGWAMAFVYAVSVALRLARFNSQPESDNQWFKGLPCPSGAAVLAALLWNAEQWPIAFFDSIEWVMILMVVMLLLAILMVSSVPYPSFKDIGDKGKVSFKMILGISLLLVLLFLETAPVLLVSFVSYALSGPILWCCHRHKGVKK